MRRLLLSVLIVFIFCGGLKAQRGRGLVDKSQESQNYITFTLGPDFCFADTKGAPYDQSVLKNFDLSAAYRKIYANSFGYRLALGYSHFTGTDAGTSLKNRGFSFSSKVLQLSLLGEYDIKIGRQYYYRPTPNVIYGFLGAGVLSSNADLIGPSGSSDSHTFQRDRYTFHPTYVTPVIPFGLGYHYNIYDKFLVGAEVSWKIPLSDYVDGFGPPYPDSKSNDLMFGFSLTFSFLLESEYLKRH